MLFAPARIGSTAVKGNTTDGHVVNGLARQVASTELLVLRCLCCYSLRWVDARENDLLTNVLFLRCEACYKGPAYAVNHVGRGARSCQISIFSFKRPLSRCDNKVPFFLGWRNMTIFLLNMTFGYALSLRVTQRYAERSEWRTVKL